MDFYSGLIFKQSLYVEHESHLPELQSRVLDHLRRFDVADVTGLPDPGSISD